MKKLIFATALLLSIAIQAYSQLQNATDNTIAKVKSANANITTISSNFKRTSKMAFIDQAVEVDGKFYYTKPQQLSMLYSNSEVFIINGDNVTVGKKGKPRNVKAKNKQVEALASTLLSCMAGDVATLNGTLTSTDKSSKYITYKVKVDFQVGKGSITELELKYDASDMTFRSLNLIEADGSYTLYELQTKTLNQSIDSSVYETKKQQ